jgi:hypothetical protein
MTIYCVIPEALEDELFQKMVEHYKDDPDVEVIVDRRQGRDRRKASGNTGPDERREIRDRRQRRPSGSFPKLHGE